MQTEEGEMFDFNTTHGVWVATPHQGAKANKGSWRARQLPGQQFAKIHIFKMALPGQTQGRAAARAPVKVYLCSTTWSRTCREARQRASEALGIPACQLRANFAGARQGSGCQLPGQRFA
jgi:hypothetical protein